MRDEHTRSITWDRDVLPELQENSTSFQMLLLEMPGSFHSSPPLKTPPLPSSCFLLPFFRETLAPGRGNPLVTASEGLKTGSVWRKGMESFMWINSFSFHNCLFRDILLSVLNSWRNKHTAFCYLPHFITGVYDKIPQTQWLKNNEHLCVIVLWAGKTKIKVLQSWWWSSHSHYWLSCCCDLTR